MRKQLILFTILTVGLFQFSAFAQKPLEQILLQEAKRNLEQLSKEAVPAYYISYRVYEPTVESAVSIFGELQNISSTRNRFIRATVRVGSPEQDNTREIKEGYSMQSMHARFDLPLDDNEDAIRLLLWNHTDKLYKDAVNTYEKVKANVNAKVASEDKSPDFSIEKREQYKEKEIPFSSLKIKPEEFQERIKRYSGALKANPDVVNSYAVYEIKLLRSYFADTEGAAIAQNNTSFRIDIQAYTIADDGMQLPLFKSYYSDNSKELPGDKVIMKDIEDMSQMLSRLKVAPLADTYSGPALLSSEATGVFFHEFLGHRVEGARMKRESDSQAFKKKIGEMVMDKDISLFFDPSIRKYKDIQLSGSYVFDDEGVRGQKVNIIENGKLVNFLMSRTPIEGHLNSNGHGRGEIHYDPVTRQSNMIIESTSPKTEQELRTLLKDELKKQNKPYGYLFSQVSGGFTQTGRYSPNAFNVTPLIVYRVYADDKPDELVRGVNLIGTPLSIFSQITACGTELGVFNGYCGAESGRVPVSCVAPSVFVKLVETQKQAKSQAQPPILSRP